MTEGEEDVKTREQILSDAEGEADHKGKQTQLQTVNNALIRNQTQQQVRLEEERRAPRKLRDVCDLVKGTDYRSNSPRWAVASRTRPVHRGSSRYTLTTPRSLAVRNPISLTAQFATQFGSDSSLRDTSGCILYLRSVWIRRK
jgi:hypothetical protein